MKYLYFLVLFFFVCTTVLGQWNPNGATTGNIYYNGGNVGVGYNTPLEKLHINGAIRGNGAGGALRVNTDFGYLDLGPMNNAWAHFQTNLDKFHFNKPIYIDGALSSYNTKDLDFQTHGVQRMRILNSNGYIGIGTTNPQGTLQVNGYRPVIIKSNGGQGIYGSEIGFNAILLTDTSPNVFRKLGGTGQNGGASIAVNHTGSMYFQMYDGGSEAQSETPFAPQIVFLNTGDVGIGTTSPTAKLHVNGIIKGKDFITVDKGGSYRVALNGQNHGYIVGRDDSSIDKFVIRSNGVSYFNGGSVGIGIMNPHHMLDVNGQIHSREVIVDMEGWPDYVFDSTYNLPPLSEVEAYIKTNNHLPEIPSEAEVKENGVALGEMNALLLKKIEELTLYVIELEKARKALETANMQLQEENITIKQEMSRIDKVEEEIATLKELLNK